MAWEVWWALVLGLRDLRDRAGLGAAAVDRSVRCPARERGRSALATGLGAASSSCSYAAIAIAKSLFQKGASAATALAFQFASTNLVWELGLVLWVLIGWQFTLAEYLGGIVMIVLMTLVLRLFVSPRLEREAREHAAAGRQRTPAPHGRRAAELAPAPHVGLGMVGRGAQLPRRLADALQGDRDRLPARRLRRPARQRLLQRPVPERHRRRARDDRERDRRADHRRAVLRVLGRQRAARRRAVVGRDQLRRRARVPVRRPDRAADHPRLPQVLRRPVSPRASSR